MRFYAMTFIKLLLLLGTGLVIGHVDKRNIKNGCIVPPNPNNGKYFQGFEPGQSIRHATALRYVCNENYLPAAGNGRVYCVNGSWIPNTIECSDYAVYPEVGKSYKFHKKPQKWFDARETCLRENATLAMPENEAEVSVLIELFKKYPVSNFKNVHQPEIVNLGFHDLFKRGEYVTDRGDSIQYYYHMWNEGEPNHCTDDENCGSLNRKGKLFDSSCNKLALFVCQKNTQKMQELVGSDYIPRDPLYRYFNGTKKYYKLHLNPEVWANARATCKSEGGNLAVIRSKREEAFLVAMFSEPGNKLNHVQLPSYALLGFHDIFRENHFLTVQGENLENIGYTNWGPNQPETNLIENCGSMRFNGEIHDFPCDVSAVFFCEISNTLYH